MDLKHNVCSRFLSIYGVGSITEDSLLFLGARMVSLPPISGLTAEKREKGQGNQSALAPYECPPSATNEWPGGPSRGCVLRGAVIGERVIEAVSLDHVASCRQAQALQRSFRNAATSWNRTVPGSST